MTYAPINAVSEALPADFDLPMEPDLMRAAITERERRTSDVLNQKERGNYENQEISINQKWFTTANNQVKRDVYRKVIDLGGLNDFTAVNPQNVAHGIAITATIIITRIYGAATDPSTLYIPLPYVDMTGGGNNIQLSMDNTNIILRSNLDYSGFTTAYVVVEYIK